MFRAIVIRTVTSIRQRKKQGILRALDLEHAKAKDVSDEMRSRVKQYGIEVAQNQPSIVDLVFGGLIRSSVLCDECGTVLNEWFDVIYRDIVIFVFFRRKDSRFILWLRFLTFFSHAWTERR